jgi:uncharacterized protein involved in exopolysaccharide biosynthesis
MLPRGVTARSEGPFVRPMIQSPRMATAEAPPADAQRRPLIREDYELDLSALLARLLRHWRFIGACTLLAVLGGVLFALAQPRTYGGVAFVLISRPKLQSTMEPRLITVNDFELRPFYTHAKHPDVERAVQSKLQDELQPHERAPGTLVERLRVLSAKEDPALMELRFSDVDPVRASRITNAWAEAYIQHAQTALNPAALSQRIVDGQIKEAAAELQRRDDALRAFEQKSGLGLPLREDGTTRVELSAVAGTNPQNATLPLVVRLGTRGQEVSTRAASLAEFRAKRDQTRMVLGQARALRSASVGIAPLANELSQLGIPAGTPPDQVVAALEARDRALAETIDQIAAELRQLESALSADVGLLERLERERDVARESYVALAKKTEENKVGMAGEWPGVVLFNRSPETASADPRPWPLIVGVPALAGLLVGVVGALLLAGRAPASASRVRSRPLDAFPERAL